MTGLKYPIRINLFVSEEMDDSLDDIEALMGISKHEYIRFIIAQSLAGQKQAVSILRDMANKGCKA